MDNNKKLVYDLAELLGADVMELKKNDIIRQYIRGDSLEGANALEIRDDKIIAYGVKRRQWFNGSKDLVRAFAKEHRLLCDFPY